MTPDVCMRFLVWSYFYHGILPERNVSYASYNRFSASDAEHLDELKDTLFNCFEEQSVNNACAQFRQARINNEPCPFSQAELDAMFASEM